VHLGGPGDPTVSKRSVTKTEQRKDGERNLLFKKQGKKKENNCLGKATQGKGRVAILKSSPKYWSHKSKKCVPMKSFKTEEGGKKSKTQRKEGKI